MKHSDKREKILHIFKDGSLLTANEICERIPEIDRATIYRNLSLFASEGILREVNVKKGITSYELNQDKHQHFICTNCDKIIPVEVDPKVLLKIIPNNFKFEDFELNLKGKCKDCN